MDCWNCHFQMETPPRGKLSFRATCDRCGVWLHACINCAHYQPGKPNDCLIPGTDPISDRRSSNFCEDFSLRTTRISAHPIPSAKKRFEDLFKDS